MLIVTNIRKVTCEIAIGWVYSDPSTTFVLKPLNSQDLLFNSPTNLQHISL